MPSFLQMSLRDVFVAVAVRAIRCTPSGKRLRISPSLENSLRNVSPLCGVRIKQVFRIVNGIGSILVHTVTMSYTSANNLQGYRIIVEFEFEIGDRDGDHYRCIHALHLHAPALHQCSKAGFSFFFVSPKREEQTTPFAVRVCQDCKWCLRAAGETIATQPQRITVRLICWNHRWLTNRLPYLEALFNGGRH